MDTNDLHAAREELQVVNSLWKERYKPEPSSLREKGIAMLPAFLERTRPAGATGCHMEGV